MSFASWPRWRPAGPVQVRPIDAPGGGVDPHELAVAMGSACPALLDRQGPGDRWHVLPVAPRGALTAREGRHAAWWTGAAVARGRGRGLDALRCLLNGLRAPAPPATADLPPVGGLVVVLAYELAHEIEDLPSTARDRDGWPWLHAIACPAAVLVEADGPAVALAYLPDAGGRPGDLPWGLTSPEVAVLEARISRVLAALARGAVEPPRGHPVGPVRASADEAAHGLVVRRVLEHLWAGDVYQVNASQRFEVDFVGSALPVRKLLRERDPGARGGHVRGPGWELACNSPERLVRVRRGELLTEPIAGTHPVPEHAGPQVLARLERELARSAKDRAEHVMIVDIHRNDLGRVAEPGSVVVHGLMRLERRAHLIQAVADIRGRLREGADAVDVIEAVFPGGCITGVPKVRCMELLDELEPTRRGPYTGSMGLLSAWGDLDLNVIIRSAWSVPGRLTWQAGSGIVLDSDPRREHQECRVKARAIEEVVAALRTGPAAGRGPAALDPG